MKELWTEKHAPRKMEDFNNDPIITEKFNNYIEKKIVNSLILVGEVGTGKTAFVNVFLDTLYGKDINDYVVRLNFVDDYSLKSLNEMIRNFAYTKTKNDIKLPKILLFDGLDDILQHKNQYKYQQIISTVIDLLKTKNMCFILTCRDHNNIIEGIQSKAIIVRFNKPSATSIHNILKKICVIENTPYEEKALQILSEWVNGDMRCGINYLQMIRSVYGKIDVDITEKICVTNYLNRIDKMIDDCTKYHFKEALREMNTLLEEGNLGEDISKKMLEILIKKKMDESKKFYYIDIVSQLCVAISQGSCSVIQLSGCLAKMCQKNNI